MFIKKLLTMASILCLAQTSFAHDGKINIASDTEITLGGAFEFEMGYLGQDNLIKFEKNVSDNTKNTAFFTQATINLTVSQQINNVIAGAKIVLLPTTKAKTSASYNGSHIFFETEYGKIELGSQYDAGSNMRITAGDITAGSGAWDRYAVLDGAFLQHKGMSPLFDTCPSFYIESYVNIFNQINDKAESARKISFYTPEMRGFQFGISYTPDSANTGGNRHINNLSSEGVTLSKTGVFVSELDDNPTDQNNKYFMRLNQNVKDSISVGLSYTHELAEDVAIKVAVTGEYGKAARRMVHFKKNKNTGQETEEGTYKLSPLKAYNIGATVTYGNFSGAASYGNLGKSLTNQAYYKVGRNTYYYDGSLAYTQGPIKTSISYFKSSRYKNTVDTVSLGTQYKIMPGLLPYAEISHFVAKGKPVYYPDAANKKTKGTVGMIGARFKF